MYPVASTVPVAAGYACRDQRRGRESDLFGKLASCRIYWRLTAPDTPTGQLPPSLIRGVDQQQLWTNINRHHGALVLRVCQPPPSASQWVTKAEGCPPRKVEKWGKW